MGVVLFLYMKAGNKERVYTTTCDGRGGGTDIGESLPSYSRRMDVLCFDFKEIQDKLVF